MSKNCPSGIANCGGNWVQRHKLRFASGAGVEIPLGYGLLYNWYAVTDVRGVAPSGFRVPSRTDLQTLESFAQGDLGEVELIGTRTDSDGDPYWQNPTSGNGLYGLNLYAGGQRDGSAGGYELLRSQTFLWSTTINNAASSRAALVNNSGISPNNTLVNDEGVAIRCVSDTEPLNATVQDADGNHYSWVQIGSQYWLQQNLKTTKFNNGDDIPTGFSNTDWANLTTAGWAYPNGDSSLPI